MGHTPKKLTVEAKDLAKQPGSLKCVGGSRSDDWNSWIADAVLNTLWLKHSDEETRNQQFNAALAGLMGIAPKDELEGMIAAQLIAAQSAVMECYRRAMLGEQTFEGRRENLSQANKLSRTFTVLLEALNRRRGKGQQKVTVEHVHVHSGGQAVVGTVETSGGGDRSKVEDQPHATQIAHAPQPTMLSQDTTRDTLSVAGDAERAMPDAWRKVAGGTEGE